VFVELYVVLGAKFLENPACERRGFVVEENTAILDTWFSMDGLDRESIDIRLMRYFNVCPPIPP
jgi:hypothetical protein